MKLPRGAAAALALLALTAGRAHAQAYDDARVLPRGFIEVRGFGEYLRYDSRLDGGSQPLGAPYLPVFQSLAARLTAPVVPTLRSSVAAFFSGTAGQVSNPVAPADIAIGDIAFSASSDIRTVPLSIGYGVTSRISVVATVPVERRGTSVSALFLRDGTVGVNANPTRNAQLLGRIDASYGALGTLAFLPTAGSEAGIELQRRVKAIVGDSVALILPERGVTLTQLLGDAGRAALLTEDERAALGVRSAAETYALGDVEVGARIQLANTSPGYPFPDTLHARGFRSTLGVRARIGTGASRDTAFLLEIPSQSGHSGFGVELLNDWFLSRKWWVTATAGYDHRFSADVVRRAFAEDRAFPPDSAFRTLSRSPGARIEASVTPRYRLTREFGFAAHYGFEHVGETSFSASDDRGPVVLNPFEDAGGWTAHRVGFGASYSTYEAYRQGRSRAPVEFWLLYRNTVAGSGLAPEAGTIEFGGRFIYQLVGRPRRPRADTTVADTTPTPPQGPARVEPQLRDKPEIRPRPAPPAEPTEPVTPPPGTPAPPAPPPPPPPPPPPTLPPGRER